MIVIVTFTFRWNQTRKPRDLVWQKGIRYELCLLSVRVCHCLLHVAPCSIFCFFAYLKCKTDLIRLLDLIYWLSALPQLHPCPLPKQYVIRMFNCAFYIMNCVCVFYRIYFILYHRPAVHFILPYILPIQLLGCHNCNKCLSVKFTHRRCLADTELKFLYLSYGCC